MILLLTAAASLACSASAPASHGTTDNTGGSGGDDQGAGGNGGAASAGTGGSGGVGGTGGSAGVSGSGGSAGTGDLPPDASATGGSGGTAIEPDAAVEPPMDAGSAGRGGGGGGGGYVDAAVSALPKCSRDVQAMDANSLMAAIAGLKPGDCVHVADGTYPAFTVGAQGTEAAPIFIQAQNRLKAKITGEVTFEGAAWATVEGFATNGVHINNSKHCRFSRAQVPTGTGSLDVGGNSDSNRIDHCDIGGNPSSGDVMHPGGLSTNTLMDHNYFHDLHAPHTITMGCCGPTYDYHDTGDIAEFNLFVNCMSGAELFSVKSSASTIRYNTVRNCAGDVDIRSGRHNAIYGNWIFNGTGNFGIRMYEDDHRIFDNYVESARAIAVGPGHPGHAQVHNATIVNNTFVGRVAFGDDANTNFSNNIVVGPITITAGVGGPAPINPTYQDNILASGMPPSVKGFAVVDPKLMRMGDFLDLTAGSPAIGAGLAISFVSDDILGTARGGKYDIGAQQLSSKPGPRHPLTTADVGPDAP